jgi:hypothetical protein
VGREEWAEGRREEPQINADDADQTEEDFRQDNRMNSIIEFDPASSCYPV